MIGQREPAELDRMFARKEVAMPRNKAPLRELTFRIVGPLVGLVIGLGIGAVLIQVLIGGRFRIPWWVFVIGFVFLLVIASAAIIGGLLIGQQLVGDRIEGAIREPGSKWRHGRLDVESNAIVFERYLLKVRIPSGEKQRFDQVDIGEDIGLRPPLRQLWSINPQLHIVSIDAQQGHFELAALPSRIQELRDRIHDTLPL